MKLFMNTTDKIEVENEIHCPPHCLPHRIPLIEEKVTDEPCHFHEKLWRMMHHKSFCQLLKCPNYETMMTEYKKYKEVK